MTEPSGGKSSHAVLEESKQGTPAIDFALDRLTKEIEAAEQFVDAIVETLETNLPKPKQLSKEDKNAVTANETVATEICKRADRLHEVNVRMRQTLGRIKEQVGVVKLLP